MNALADLLPHLNASLNAVSALLLLTGLWSIRKRRISWHRRCMLTALFCSVLFLISYLVRFYLTGVHRYAGDGWDRTLYLIVLGTHTPLAASVPPLAGRALYLAFKQRFESHKKWARVTFPIWMYVSVTGVIIYGMLYR